MESSIEETYGLYQHLVEEGEFYGAVLRLALTFDCLPNLPDNLRLKWLARIRAQHLTDDAISIVEAGVRKDTERITKILSIGNRWNEDEILLIVLTRDGLEKVIALLEAIYSRKLMMSLSEIDQKISDLAGSRAHRGLFETAIEQMKINEELPTENRWVR